MTTGPGQAEARRTIEDLLASRDPGKTICPSDAARVLGGDDGFRPLMDTVRAAAQELVDAGRIEITQKGRRVDLDTVKGPIRLGAIGALAARQGEADGERGGGRRSSSGGGSASDR